MTQSYAFIHKNNVFSENFVLNFLKSNNLKGNSGELAATLNWVAAMFVSSIPCGYAKYRRRKG